MQDLWLAFIQDPVNGLPAQGWDAYAPGGDAIEFAWDGMVTQMIPLSRFGDYCEGSPALSPVPGAVPPVHVSGL